MASYGVWLQDDPGEDHKLKHVALTIKLLFKPKVLLEFLACYFYSPDTRGFKADFLDQIILKLVSQRVGCVRKPC